MSYGVYYSFDGIRWYFACECDLLDVACGAGRSAAKLRGANRWQVRDANENVILGGYA